MTSSAPRDSEDSTSHPTTPNGSGSASLDETIADPDAGSSDFMPGGATPPPDVAPGTSIGRYVLVDRLGRGGMGEVYRAFDPELARLVALKYVRFDRQRQHEARARLYQEARAIAQVTHPNVVAVYDVGGDPDDPESGSQVFIAMELVEGPTLRAWLRGANDGKKPRGTSEILELFLRAGRGLAAAHERGIVHRDFKPENVLLTKSGIPKVVDFGLAKATTSALTLEAEGVEGTKAVPEPEDQRDALHDGLTRAGARLGTPAYMSPEQWGGLEVDERCDQFSFAVALWEALYGELPFAGPTVDAYGFQVMEGERRPPPRDTTVPRHLRDVLERALQVDPGQRYENFPALLDALALDPGRRTRTLLGLGLATVAAIGLTAGGYVLAQRSKASQYAGCLEAVEDRVSHWNEAERDRVRETLLATQRPFAEGVAKSTLEGLDRARDRWQEMASETCRDLGVPELPDEAELEAARRACLQRGISRHRDFVESLPDLPAKNLEYVPDAVARVEAGIEACRDVAYLRDAWRVRSVAVDHPDVARALELIETDLSLGAAASARARFDEIESPPKDGSWPHALYADYMRARVRLELTDGDPVEALAWLDEAFARLVGSALPAYDKLEFQALLAEARYAAGDYEGMRSAYRRHYELSLAQLGSDDIEVAHAYAMQGHYHHTQGAYGRAVEFYAEGLDRARRISPSAPQLDELRQWLAQSQLELGEVKEAAEAFEAIVAQRRARLGDAHPDTLGAEMDLAKATLRLGDTTKALQLLNDALAKHRSDPTWKGTRDEVALLGNLGAMLIAAGQHERAIERLEEGMALLGTAGVADDDPFADALRANLGTALLATGAPDRALELLRAAARHSQRRGDDTSRNGMTIRRELARAEFDSGHTAEGRRLLEAVALDAERLGQPDVQRDAWSTLAEVARLHGDANLSEMAETRAAQVGKISDEG